jgi:hypothetical protein
MYCPWYSNASRPYTNAHNMTPTYFSFFIDEKFPFNFYHWSFLFWNLVSHFQSWWHRTLHSNCKAHQVHHVNNIIWIYHYIITKQIWCTRAPVLLVLEKKSKIILLYFKKNMKFILQIHTHVLNTCVKFR